MSETVALPVDTHDGYLRALTNAAAILDWPLRRERDDATCRELARAIDALLVRVARGRGALDIAIGEGLDALAGPVPRLGFSCIGDYARERLGIAASTAQKMIRFARALRERPLLRGAVRKGEVPLRAAEAVLPVARGDAEALWVERARNETVRALKAAVKNSGAEPDLFNDEEKWIRTRGQLAPEERAIVDKAIDLAKKALCATAPRWELVTGMSQEYLGAHDPPRGALDDPFPAPREELESVKEWLENESAQWVFLDHPEPIEAPELRGEHDPWLLDAELRRLSGLRDRWGEVFGHLAMLLRAVGAWGRLGFASFEHYCTERLSMSVRAVAERAVLEQKLYDVPGLREALRERRLSYEKARLIARYAGERSVVAWIERAESIPCITLRRELQQEEDRQMCARGEFEVWAPRSSAAVIALAFSAARKAAGHWISAGECLTRIAQHFIDIWEPALKIRSTLHARVLERDGWLCQFPGCSKAADHAHHIDYRSRGGSDDLSNLTSLCAVHHLQGVHMGRIRVWGQAPHNLRWEVIGPP